MFTKILQREPSAAAPMPAFPARLAAEDIQLSAAAAARFRQLAAAVADDGLAAIRLYVTGGGCNGMSYGMTYAPALTPWDAVLEGDGFRLAVDAVALNYLRGCSIDYAKQGLNESFMFKNVFQSVGGSGGCSGCSSKGGSRY